MDSDLHLRRLWIAAAAGVILLGTAVRFWINFSSAYPPGINAAYYPLQARAWLTHHRLMYDDLPLIFWLNAALGKLLVVFGRPLDGAVLMASRILDSVIEPWVAAAIMALGYAWSDGRRQALAGCTAAATLAVLSPPVMRMLSEFEKNSLGLVLMAFALFAAREAMLKQTAKAWLTLAAILGLAALTHVGAFAVTCTMIVTALAVWSWFSVRQSMRLVVVGCFAAGLAVLIAGLAYFDPHRASRLVHAPVELFRGSALAATGKLAIDSPPIPILLVAALLIALVIWLLRRDHHSLYTADIAVVLAAATTTMILICPKSYVYFDRLMLMVPIPATILLVFVVGRLHGKARIAGYAMSMLALFAAVASPSAIQRPLMNEGAAREFREIRTEIRDADSTLVIAPHGLEWWAGYFLGTPVRSSVSNDADRQYRRVLFLRYAIDCPPEVVSPFAVPNVSGDGPKIYGGHYLDLSEVKGL